MTKTTTVKPFSGPRYSLNCQSGVDNCVICGRATKEKNVAGWTHVRTNITFVALGETVDPQNSQGWWPIGKDCLRAAKKIDPNFKTDFVSKDL